MPDRIGRVARDGQQRLVSLLDDMLSDTRDGHGGCTCIVRATEVELLLHRQTKLESAALRSNPPGSRPAG